MIGNTGTGKTHISIGLGLKDCKEGYNVKFYTVANLVTELTEAQEYKKLLKLEKQLEKVDLLILHELLYLCFNRNQADLLFIIISDRSEKGNIIVSTNLEFSRWTEIFENTTQMVALQMLILLTYVNKSKYHFQKPTINHRKSPLAMAQKFISIWITFSIAEVAQKFISIWLKISIDIHNIAKFHFYKPL